MYFYRYGRSRLLTLRTPRGEIAKALSIAYESWPVKTLAPDSRPTVKGTVKFFHYRADRNYGWIVRDGEPDLYVHVTGIWEGQKLEAGDSVEFKISERNGKGPRAEEVRRVE